MYNGFFGSFKKKYKHCGLTNGRDNPETADCNIYPEIIVFNDIRLRFYS